MKENKAASRTSYTKAKGDAICERLMLGESLRKITRDEDMPSTTSVMRWLQSDEEWGVAFCGQYARARREQAELNAERLIEVAEDAEETSAGVQKARLLSDNIKWSAAKLLPKVYGDRLDVTVDASSLPPPQVIVQIVNAPRPKQLDDVEDADFTVSDGEETANGGNEIQLPAGGIKDAD